MVHCEHWWFGCWPQDVLSAPPTSRTPQFRKSAKRLIQWRIVRNQVVSFEVRAYRPVVSPVVEYVAYRAERRQCSCRRAAMKLQWNSVGPKSCGRWLHSASRRTVVISNKEKKVADVAVDDDDDDGSWRETKGRHSSSRLSFWFSGEFMWTDRAAYPPLCVNTKFTKFSLKYVQNLEATFANREAKLFSSGGEGLPPPDQLFCFFLPNPLVGDPFLDFARGFGPQVPKPSNLPPFAWWRYGKALDLRLTGRGFNSQPVRFNAT